MLLLKTLKPLLVTMLILPSLPMKGQVNVQDSLALVDLYNSTNGNGWLNKTNWLSSQPVSTWYGITVNSNRVFTIDLRTNNLSGPIPTTIGNLIGLQSLQFDQNPMGGSIPASIGNLVNLQYLSMIQDQFTGSIPSTIGNLTNLVWLRLADNNLSGTIPPTLGNLINLSFINLGNNQLTGPIPASIGNLTKLIELILVLNQLTGSIPSSLGNPALVNLQSIELDLNHLTGSIPASIGNLPNLSTFTTQSNMLSGPIPPFNGAAKFLNLYLQDNFFTFAGMEAVAQKTVWQKFYAPQGIIPVKVSCGKLSVSVGGTPSNNTYRWYNSAGVLQATIPGDSTFTPSAPDSYYVTVTNSIATLLTLHSDTVTSGVVKKLVNAKICPNSFYTLPSGKQVNISGTYNDTVKSATGCGDSLITLLTLTVNTVTISNKNAGICGGQFYILPSGAQVNSSGIYHDTLRSVLGCDSIITVVSLAVNNPIKKNVNGLLCMGQQYQLPSGRLVNQPGTYMDTLRSATLGCDSIITTLALNIDPSVNQLNDSIGICPGSASVTLNAGNNSNTYTWSTGSNLNSITVSSPGLYSVQVKGTNGCIANDSFHVFSYNKPVVSLNQNIILCTGQPRTIDAGSGYTQYLWNTGSTNQTISILSTGIYWVAVTDRYNCAGSDTTNVNQTVNPPSGFLPPDTAMCAYTNFTLAAAAGFEKYSWNTGESSAYIIVSQPGAYTLTVTDTNTCVGTATTNINSKGCTEEILVPNAFTPNADGHNDILRPINLNNTILTRFHFIIFNRWGQRVFESSDSKLGWDGRIQGVDQDYGVYVWQLEYQFPVGPITTKKGTVVLIR